MACPAIVQAQPARLTVSERNERASFQYASSQAQASLARLANAEISRLRDDIARRDGQIATTRQRIRSLTGRIEELQQAQALLEALLDEATREKEQLLNLLVERDVQFAIEREALLDQANTLLETPQGAEALRLFNEGGRDNYLAAQAILAAERRVRTASDLRTSAKLASSALERADGSETVAGAIIIWEAVVEQAPRLTDLLELGRLYGIGGRLQDFVATNNRLEQFARTEKDRMQIALQTADAAFALGDSVARRSALQRAIGHGETLVATSDEPANPFLLALARYALVVEAAPALDVATARTQVDLALSTFAEAAAANPGNVLIDQEVIRGKLLSLAVGLAEQATTLEGARRLSRQDYDPTPFQAVLAEARTLSEANPGNFHVRGVLAGLVCGTSGLIMQFAPAPAALLAGDCLARTRDYVNADSSNLAAQMNLVDALRRKAQVDSARGDWHAAYAAVDEALGISRTVSNLSPALVQAKAAQAGLLVDQAVAAFSVGRRDNIASMLDESLSLFEQLLLVDPDNPQYHRSIADACIKAADNQVRVSGAASAVPYLVKGLASARAVSSRTDALWQDHVTLVAYLVVMAQEGIGGVSPGDALEQLDLMERRGAVVPEGRQQFDQLRATLRGLQNNERTP